MIPALGAAPLINRAHPLSQGLVFAAPLFEGGGIHASDYSGYGAHGSFSGSVAWTASQQGTIPKFNGTDTLLAFGNAELHAPDRISVGVLWKNDSASPAQFDGIAGKTNLGSWNQGWGLFWDTPAGTLKFFINQYNGVGVATAVVTNPDRWHYFLATFDGGSVRLFVDGVEGTSASYSTPLSVKTNPLELGRLGTNSFNAAGQCADFRIYNRALSPAEIRELSLDPWQIFRFDPADTYLFTPPTSAAALGGFPLALYVPEEVSEQETRAIRSTPTLVHAQAINHRHRGWSESAKLEELIRSGPVDLHRLQTALSERELAFLQSTQTYQNSIDTLFKQLQDLRMKILWRQRN